MSGASSPETALPASPQVDPMQAPPGGPPGLGHFSWYAGQRAPALHATASRGKNSPCVACRAQSLLRKGGDWPRPRPTSERLRGPCLGNSAPQNGETQTGERKRASHFTRWPGDHNRDGSRTGARHAPSVLALPPRTQAGRFRQTPRLSQRPLGSHGNTQEARKDSRKRRGSEQGRVSRELTSPFGLKRLKDAVLTYAGPGWGDRCGVFLAVSNSSPPRSSRPSNCLRAGPALPGRGPGWMTGGRRGEGTLLA